MMNAAPLNFDLYAMAQPKSRNDLKILAGEIIAELNRIDAHLDAAIAACEATETV